MAGKGDSDGRGVTLPREGCRRPVSASGKSWTAGAIVGAGLVLLSSIDGARGDHALSQLFERHQHTNKNNDNNTQLRFGDSYGGQAGEPELRELRSEGTHDDLGNRRG